MKRSKWILVLATLLLCGLLLSSCGSAPKRIENWEAVMDPTYQVLPEARKTLTRISELDDCVAGQSFTGRYPYIWFNAPPMEEGRNAYKLYNMIQGKVTLTLASDTYQYAVENLAQGMIQVREYKPQISHYEWTEGGGGGLVATEPAQFISLTVYDVAGNELLRLDEERTVECDAFADMVNLEGELYAYDETTGTYNKKEIPEYLVLSGNDRYIGAWNEKYYYANTVPGLVIYDRDLQPLSVWNAPSYAEEKLWFALNDGNVLIQYRHELEENAKEFDYYTVSSQRTRKYRLVTLLYDVETGETKEIRLPYVVDRLKSSYELRRENEGNQKYSDGFENVAYVYPIVDQRIDTSAAAMDMVLMSNEGKIERSLKLVDGQAAVLPEKVGDDLYRVSMLSGGYAIVNGTGEILRTINNTSFLERNSSSSYPYSKKAVYNHAFEMVYDLEANHAEVMQVMLSALFVRVNDPESENYKVVLIYEDVAREIYSYDASVPHSDELFLIDNLGYAIRGWDEARTYAYYSLSGKKLLSATEELGYVAASYGEAEARLFYGKASDQYYILTK